MISILQHIKSVEVSFDKTKVITSLPHINKAEGIKLDIPLDITYNENWLVSHSCGCDNTSISFSKNKKLNWFVVNKLFSKFYKTEMLEKLADAFDSLHILVTEKSKFEFLTKVEFNDTKAAIYAIPRVNFNMYKCENCCKHYLCRFSEGIAREPDRDVPQGLPGRLIIHEIVEFEFTSEDRFSTFEKNP